MRNFSLGLLISLVVLTGCATGTGQTPKVTPTAGISEDARVYLEEAFDFVRDTYVLRHSIDWTTLHTTVFAAAQHAQTKHNTYAAIQLLLEKLQSPHSNFVEPQTSTGAVRGGYGYNLVVNPQQADTYTVAIVYAGSPAEQGGLKVGDVILSQEQTADQIVLHIQRKSMAQPLTLTLQRGIFNTSIAPTGQRLGQHVGYINVPGFIGDGAAGLAYAQTMQSLIQSLDGPNICGWVVDMRQNTGGIIYPMIAGVGPILGEGQLGTFISADGTEPWAYQNGVASDNGQAEVSIAHPYHLVNAQPPVALLTSQVTSSAGEAVVVSFAGRPSTERIGEATTGVPVGTATHDMPDGATVVVTAAYEADRTAHNYGEAPIPPQQAVTMDWTLLRTPSDPTIQAGLGWLRSSAGCTA